MKRVLITGAFGSIGAHVVAHIMETTDWNVVAIDSFRHKGEFDRITTVCQEHPEWRSRITIIYHDLTAPFTEREVAELGEVDYIVNLASLSDVQASIDDPKPFVRNNTELMLNTLELACMVWRLTKDNHVPPPNTAFVQFSTDEVYGPARVDQSHKEWSVILPSNPYAASKAMQEALAISYWRSYGLPLIITNTMNNFGEMQQPDKYPVKIQKAIENGELVTVHSSSDGQMGTRYYLHSKNAADAVLFILQNTVPYLHKAGLVDRPDRYNIVGSRQLSNLELAQLIARLMGKELRYKLVDFHSLQPGHDLHYGLDGSKLDNLGWKPLIGFEESLTKTIEWQKSHKGWIQ